METVTIIILEQAHELINQSESNNVNLTILQYSHVVTKFMTILHRNHHVVTFSI